jgi:peptidylprolyl isomerase
VRKPAGILLFSLACAVGAACGGSSSGGSGNGSAGGAGVTVAGPLGSKPTVTVPSGTPPTTLLVKDITAGSGAEAASGKTVTVQYVGVAWSTKQEFDASWDRGQAFPFQLGTGQVIPGWDQGVAGMKVGGRRLLVIPPQLGYGAAGAGQAIGPNETLVFVVDLVSVT